MDISLFVHRVTAKWIFLAHTLVVLNIQRTNDLHLYAKNEFFFTIFFVCFMLRLYVSQGMPVLLCLILCLCFYVICVIVFMLCYLFMFCLCNVCLCFVFCLCFAICLCYVMFTLCYLCCYAYVMFYIIMFKVIMLLCFLCFLPCITEKNRFFER